ncbi:MAG: DUF421 domain-containing protein [Clostridia bacterium]|nr:DUF421 domain-containing protein [Clostridia bacterium]
MLTIFVRTALIFLFLHGILKIMGKREIGQLEVDELISTLLISELAALPINDPDIPLLYTVVPISLIVGFEILLSYIKNKSRAVEILTEGEPEYLVFRGRLMQSALAKNRISLSEFLSQLRLSGVTSLSDLDYVILEQSGQMSVILKEEKQPLTAESLSGGGGGLSHPLILDGKVIYNNMKALGYTEKWLNGVLMERGVKRQGVFFLSIDDGGNIVLIETDSQVDRRKVPKAVLIAGIALFLITGAVIGNDIFIRNAVRETERKVEAVSAGITAEEARQLYGEFLDLERTIALSVNHEDLTHVEESFADFVGCAEAQDTAALLQAKSRLSDALMHLGRLSGLKFDTLF